MGILTSASNVQPAETIETIYIRVDGSVYPPTAPIQRDGDVYTFTDNISGSIVVERDSIIVVGAGYTLQGPGPEENIAGIKLMHRNNVTIKNVKIRGFSYGICIGYSFNITIVQNDITTRGFGIDFFNSHHSIIIHNNITENGAGIELWNSSNNLLAENNVAFTHGDGIYLGISSNNVLERNNITMNVGRGIYIQGSNSSHNIIRRNNILSNREGGIYSNSGTFNTIIENNIINNGFLIIDNRSFYAIEFFYSSNNRIYHNTFINNTCTSWESINEWDNGYPSGGNYWSDAEFLDEFSGPGQNQPGSDGICDKPYVIDEDNIDHYPLMKPYEYKPVEGFIPSEYLKDFYKLANFTLLKDWVWKNCIPLLLLNSRSTQVITPEGIVSMCDADTNLQDKTHRPDWYWRVVVDPTNKRFCVQLIAYWLYQWAGIEQCSLLAQHPYDYEPIFLYFTYDGDDFFSSLQEGKVEYQYLFCPVGHGMVKFGKSKGTDCDANEDEKLYFWTDEEGNKHPVFSIGTTFLKSYLVSSSLWTSLAGHAYGYVKRKGLFETGEDLVNLPAAYQFEDLWPDNKDYSNFQKHVHYLNDSIITEWSRRLDNPFKLIPLFSDKSGPSYDLVDPWNSLYEGKYPSVGDVFNPNSLFYLGINYTVSSAPEEGEWSKEFNYTSVKADKIVFYLNWEGEVDLDLHVWLAQEENGKLVKISKTHVGKNYETHEIENRLDDYKVINYLKVDYSGNEKPEKITISAYNYLLGRKIKAKIPSLSFIIQVYSRKAGEDPSFMLVSQSYDESTIEKVIPSAEANSYEFLVPWEGKNYRVTILSNASVSDFEFNRFEKEISFNATKGFFNVTIPKELLDGEFEVFLDDISINYELKQNVTHSMIFFDCNEGRIFIRGTTVIPEFQMLALPLTLLLMTILTVLTRKLKNRKKHS